MKKIRSFISKAITNNPNGYEVHTKIPDYANGLTAKRRQPVKNRPFSNLETNKKPSVPYLTASS